MPLTVTSFVARTADSNTICTEYHKRPLSAAELTSQLGLFCLLIARELRMLSFFKILIYFKCNAL